MRKQTWRLTTNNEGTAVWQQGVASAECQLGNVERLICIVCHVVDGVVVVCDPILQPAWVSSKCKHLPATWTSDCIKAAFWQSPQN